MATKTMHSAEVRKEILERVSRLKPDATPRWGKKNAGEMVVHLTDSFRMATGELPIKFKKTFISFPLVRKLIIYALPFPKGAPTAPALRSRVPAAWDGEQQSFAKEMENIAAKDVNGSWPCHPIFGDLSGKDWGVLGYKHCDHHLRQFGA